MKEILFRTETDLNAWALCLEIKISFVRWKSSLISLKFIFPFFGELSNSLAIAELSGLLITLLVSLVNGIKGKGKGMFLGLSLFFKGDLMWWEFLSIYCKGCSIASKELITEALFEKELIEILLSRIPIFLEMYFILCDFSERYFS